MFIYFILVNSSSEAQQNNKREHRHWSMVSPKHYGENTILNYVYNSLRKFRWLLILQFCNAYIIVIILY